MGNLALWWCWYPRLMLRPRGMLQFGMSFSCSRGGGPDLVAFVSGAGGQQEKVANGPGQHRNLGEKRESSQGSVWCCQS